VTLPLPVAPPHSAAPLFDAAADGETAALVPPELLDPQPATAAASARPETASVIDRV
jgi:hypothetical protein